jgi:hypothetical protein
MKTGLFLEGTVFAQDWENTLAAITKLQEGVCDNHDSRYFAVSENKVGTYLRFSKPVFEKIHPGSKGMMASLTRRLRFLTSCETLSLSEKTGLHRKTPPF